MSITTAKEMIDEHQRLSTEYFRLRNITSALSQIIGDKRIQSYPKVEILVCITKPSQSGPVTESFGANLSEEQIHDIIEDRITKLRTKIDAIEQAFESVKEQKQN